MTLTDEQLNKLGEALPPWAVKPHPIKTGMSSINPMAIIDRLNEVFGVANWSFTTEFISCNPAIQKTKNGERNVFVATVKGRLEIDDCVIEQYGGNTNDDAGDTLKGSATDALTKIASYLGIGAQIYKGHGNTPQNAPQGSTDDSTTPFVGDGSEFNQDSTGGFNRFKRD